MLQDKKPRCRCYWPIDALHLITITKSKMFSEMGEDSGDYVIVGDVRQRKAASLHLQVTREKLFLSFFNGLKISYIHFYKKCEGI